MEIGLDYDGTASRDIDLTLDLIRDFHAHGHYVYLVTWRTEKELFDDDTGHFSPIDRRIANSVDAIVACARNGKRDTMTSFGYDIAYWIDDQPETIIYSPTLISGLKAREDMTPKVITEVR